jgi:hypothetical protein
VFEYKGYYFVNYFDITHDQSMSNLKKWFEREADEFMDNIQEFLGDTVTVYDKGSLDCQELLNNTGVTYMPFIAKLYRLVHGEEGAIEEFLKYMK